MGRAEGPEAGAPDAPPRCPGCGRRRGAAVLYGYPAPDAWPAIERAVKEGRAVPGGCCVGGADPAYRCASCGHEWGEARP